MWATNDLSDYSANAILRDGTPVRIRAIRPGDKQRLALHFEGLSNDSRYHRFFGVKNRLSSHELRYFTEPDFMRHVALVVTTGNFEDSETIVSDGRYVALGESQSVAEVALSVVDAYQRRGAGKLLLESLIELARYVHLERLEADVMASNRGAMRFLIRRGFKSTGTSGGVCRVALSVETHDGGSSLPAGHPPFRACRSERSAPLAGRTSVSSIAVSGPSSCGARKSSRDSARWRRRRPAACRAAHLDPPLHPCACAP
ncbi:MAG: N-acetyltransferase family protein [Candidatus Binataceae bacterium]